MTRVLRAAAPRKDDRSANRRAGEVDAAIGGRLRTARMAAALSLEELAGRIDISVQQLHKYECGTNRVSVSRLIDLCDALGIEIDTIIQSERRNSAEGPDAAEITQLVLRFCSLRNPASRKQIMDLTNFLAGFETLSE